MVPNHEHRWVSSLEADGNVYFRLGRIGTDYVVEWTDMVAVRLSPSGEVREVKKVDGADVRLVGKILDYSIPAMAAHLAGELSFHASAIVYQGRAFAFLGPSGRGKSTFATSLCLRAGATLLADDITYCTQREGQFFARGVETQSWLTASARRELLSEVVSDGGKEPVPLTALSQAPLSGLVLLEEATEVNLSPLKGIRAAEALLGQLIRLELEDPSVQMRDLERVELLIRAVPVFVLQRPLNFDALPLVLRTVESMMRQA